VKKEKKTLQKRGRICQVNKGKKSSMSKLAPFGSAAVKGIKSEWGCKGTAGVKGAKGPRGKKGKDTVWGWSKVRESLERTKEGSRKNLFLWLKGRPKQERAVKRVLSCWENVKGKQPWWGCTKEKKQGRKRKKKKPPPGTSARPPTDRSRDESHNPRVERDHSGIRTMGREKKLKGGTRVKRWGGQSN